MEKLFIQMTEVNYFLESDSSSGYLQIKIDKESLNLLEFCFKQLSYDIHSTSEVFHNTVLLTTFNVQNCVQILRMTHWYEENPGRIRELSRKSLTQS